MKPMDIFDAMDNIPEKYITETELAVQRHGHTPVPKQQQAIYTETAAVNGSGADKTCTDKAVRPRTQHQQNGKDAAETGTRQPFWQRITTGIAAAAACAVFVGGGWFIARQSKLIHSDSLSSPLENEDVNILGGKGELHAAGSTALVYDDNNIYFDYLAATGSRNPGAQISAATPNAQDFPVLIYDNKYLYIADGYSLFRLGTDGRPEAEPFFTVSEELIEQAKQEFTETNPDFHEIFPESFEIQRLTDDEYFIYVTISNDAADQGLSGRAFFSVLYNAASGECSDIMDYGMEAQPAPVSTDGTAFYFKPYGLDGFCRLTLDPYDPMLFSVPEELYLFSGCGHENWIVQGNSAYYVTPGEDHDFANVRYCKYDMETLDVVVYEESPDFSSFFVSDGMLYACNKAGTQIYCATPELKNITLLFDYEQDVPEEIKASVSAALNTDSMLRPIAWLDTVDSNYLYAHLADCTYILIDRQSGEIRFYQLPKQEQLPIETAPAETDASDDADNIFGGTGTLYPVGWNNHGESTMLRDQDNYYFFDANCWFRCPLAGGQLTRIYPDIECIIPYVGFISDGERIYTPELDILSDGSAANRFDPSAAQAYLRALNAESEPKGWRFGFARIWHIRDRYFIVITANQIAGTEPTEVLSGESYEIWTDNSGSVLSYEPAKDNTSKYYCSDDKREMFAVINENLYSKLCPGDDMEGISDPTAYGAIFDAYCAGDEEYYISAENVNLYTRENGQPVLIADNSIILQPQTLYPAPDHRFFYFDYGTDHDSLYLWNGSGKKTLIFETEDGEFPSLCGFEDNASGGYSIIVHIWNYNLQKNSFLFINPDTHEIVKQITE